MNDMGENKDKKIDINSDDADDYDNNPFYLGTSPRCPLSSPM